VVAAVIGLLMAILIPALGRARGQADVIVCRVRLRQLCLASLAYAQDHDSHLPADPTMLGPSHENGRVRQGGWVDNPHCELMTMLRPYIQTTELFYCGSWKDERFAFGPENVAKGEIGYFYFSVERQPLTNGELSTFLCSPRAGDPMSYPRRLHTAMSTDTWVASDLWFSGHGSDLPAAHRWYGKGVNYVTLEGAVTMVRSGPRQVFR